MTVLNLPMYQYHFFPPIFDMMPTVEPMQNPLSNQAMSLQAVVDKLCKTSEA